jgi:hypothetical protein
MVPPSENTGCNPLTGFFPSELMEPKEMTVHASRKSTSTVVRNKTTALPENPATAIGEAFLKALEDRLPKTLTHPTDHPLEGAPSPVDAAKIDLENSPAEAFFSDVRGGAKHSNREDRLKEVGKLLGEAQRVLSFTNPDLKGKKRTWGVNATSRKLALETVDQLVTRAIRVLGA